MVSNFCQNCLFIAQFLILSIGFSSFIFALQFMFLLNNFNFLISLCFFVYFKLFNFNCIHFFNCSEMFHTCFIFKLQIFTFKFSFNFISLRLKHSIVINFNLRFNFIMLKSQRLKIADNPILVSVFHLTYDLLLSCSNLLKMCINFPFFEFVFILVILF